MKLLMQANLDVPVTMFENGNQYEVTYGAEFKSFSLFKDALKEFNSCVEHSALCASLIDSEDTECDDEI